MLYQLALRMSWMEFQGAPVLLKSGVVLHGSQRAPQTQWHVLHLLRLVAHKAWSTLTWSPPLQALKKL